MSNPDPTEIAQLSTTLNEIADAWDDAEDADTNLDGVDVQNLGERLCTLLAPLVIAPELPARLYEKVRATHLTLRHAVDYYGGLDEHDTNAALNIYELLAPALRLAEYALGHRPEPAQANEAHAAVETAADRVAAFVAAYQANETRSPSIMTIAGAVTNHQDIPLLVTDVAEVVTPELRLLAAMRLVTSDERAEDVTFRCGTADQIVDQLPLDEDGLEELGEKLDQLTRPLQLARDRVALRLYHKRSDRRAVERHARNPR